MTGTLQQLWRYNNWANQRLFASFEEHGGSMPRSSTRLLSHIVNTQSTWLNRITDKAPIVGIWEEHALQGCVGLHAETSQGLGAIMAQYDGDMQHLVAYKNQTGRSYKNTVFDILLHVFNHGTYHRAQIAQDMRANGLEPVYTDYIGFVR